eukprot:m.58316 g.58316  ORF g.58316 m.58316 type:complete len:52 (+) comp13757_c0_seq4:400-555(+)
MDVVQTKKAQSNPTSKKPKLLMLTAPKANATHANRPQALEANTSQAQCYPS